MESPSDTTYSEEALNNTLKIACPVVGIFLMSCAGYVMVSLITHFLNGRKRTKSLQNRRRIEEGSRRQKARGRGVAKLSLWLGYLSIASSVFAFLNCLVDIPSIYLRQTSNTTCKALMSFSFVFYPCGVVCVYTFLWARQRVFYSSPTLGLLRSKYLRWLSFAVLPVFLILMTAGLISTLAVYTYETAPIGCVEVSGNDSPKIVMYVGTLVMQATLLALFVYPLKEHAADGENELPENKLMISLVKRACLTTGVCVLADTTAFVIIMCLRSDGPTIIVNLIRDGNLVVNVICIVCSFADWRDRLASICRGSKQTDDSKPGEIRLIKSVKSNSRDSTRLPSSGLSIKKQQPPVAI